MACSMPCLPVEAHGAWSGGRWRLTSDSGLVILSRLQHSRRDTRSWGGSFWILLCAHHEGNNWREHPLLWPIHKYVCYCLSIREDIYSVLKQQYKVQLYFCFHNGLQNLGKTKLLMTISFTGQKSRCKESGLIRKISKKACWTFFQISDVNIHNSIHDYHCSY